MRKDSLTIMPRNRDIELSYRMKYYEVDNEKLFGDIIVTQQTIGRIYVHRNCRVPTIYMQKRQNLKREIHELPDFMALNTRKLKKRYSKTENEAKFYAIQYKEDSFHENKGQASVQKRNYPLPMVREMSQEGAISSLVDQLLLDIYGFPRGDRSRSESESTVSSLRPRPQHRYLRKARLQLKSTEELTIVLETLHSHVNHAGGLLIRQLRRRDYLRTKRDRQYDVITAHLQAYSNKRSEDTRMRFSLMPQPGESGFTQWLDAMKMVARLPGGIPQEFRKRLWLTLAERHLEQRGVDWRQAEKLCFNEWSNPDDEELGIQIVKDLHRTGCSLFCGAAGRDNQAVLRRVLLGFARWNKSVGYCQGLNVLAALVLQVTDRAESSAVKVMIYLIEGVLPEGYFADNLRGLSVDMAVFRDLLRIRLPKLSKHLEALQIDAKDKATGSSYEPPLTNVFTMQWFLTLFCHCLPQDAVLRVWDLIFLEGDEVLLRTALAIWEGISDRIMTVTSADEFYSIMGVLTREMLEFTDTNNLIKTIVNMGTLHGVTDLREKHRYNITPWARRLSDDEETDTEDEEKLAVAAAMFEVQHRLKKGYKKGHSLATGTLQAINQGGDKDRLALDISTLKHQYAKLRERQRQAHIILSAACARQSMVPPSTSQAMNHLLVGKSALVSAKTRQLGPPPGAIPPKTRLTPSRSPRNQLRKDKQGVTLHWKDTKKSRETKNEPAVTDDVDDRDVPLSPEAMSVSIKSSSRRNSGDSDSDSTSTELCDDPERLSDSEEQTSVSDCYIIATDDEKSPHSGCSPVHKSVELNKDMSFDMKKKLLIQNDVETSVSIAKITDQIRRLSAGDDNNTIVLPSVSTIDMKKINLNDNNERFMKIYESKLYDDDDIVVVNDMTTVKVDSDDFLHRNDDKIDNVGKLHENYCNYNDDNVIMDMKTTQSAQMEDKSKIDNTFRNDDLELSYLDKSLDKSTSDDHKLNKFDDVPNSKVNDEVIGKNYYSTSYVIGHLPISPMTVDQKLSKLGVSVPITTTTTTTTTTGNSPLSEEAKSSTIYDSKVSHLSLDYHQSLKPFEDLKKSPKSPESAKSFSSGETMGPDSKVSSLTTTPIRSESSNFRGEKSVNSSASSDDKTLTMKSIESEIGATRSKIESRCSLDNSSPSKSISIDSLKNKSDLSPTKIVVSSSSESYGPGKLKSTELSFSSELNSSTSANSIKYTSAYKNQDNLSETSVDINVTSPFYPITDTDQKITSPSNSITKLKNDKSPSDQNTLIKEPIEGICKLEDSSRSFKTIDKKIINKKNDDYDSGRSFEAELAATLSAKTERIGDSIGFRDKIKEDVFEKYEKRMINEDFDDRLETDTVSPLPRDKFTNLKKIPDEFASIPPTKLFERSLSVVDKRFGEMKLSSSSENFVSTQKRSSDILDDLRHMEANSLETSITRDTNMTRKTGYDWEDLKNLEARRQDTFSDSASGFSQARLDVPGITVSNELRKTYVVEPKIQMHDSDSLLQNYTRGKDHGESHDDRESKLGVWTKVKPRKKGENGRRSSSDRALKIIQENSAILHKILTCQAKKRLPDLEEISKEITISPINEEISKIFSPILEKMGLNEHEINEELARINFKDFDHMKVTNGSEFDAKINDELSKLSIIDDNEEISHVDVDEMISGDYLTTREALIDKQINEELSKLLANYDEASPISIDPYEKGSSSQNDVDGLDLTSVSTNVFSYQSSNDSIETKSDLGSIPEPMPEKFHYQDQQNYSSRKYDLGVLSPRSDIDIYRELEKLNKISSVHVLPEPLKTTGISPGAYGTDSPSYDTKLPSLDYMKPEKPFEVDPKSPYDTYTPYNFKTTKISSLTPSNSFSRSYDKPHNEGFDIGCNLTGNFDNYEIGKRQLLSKETLEFRVRYDDDNLSSEQIQENLQYRSYHPVPIDLERIGYYSDDVSINRLSKDNDRPLAISSVSSMNYPSDIDYSCKYMAKTPDNYYKSDYDRKNYQLTPNEIDSYIGTIHRRDVSPNYHYEDKNFASPYNSTIPNLSIESLEANKKTIGGELQLDDDDDDDVGCMMKFTNEVPSRESIAYRKASMTLGLNNMNRSGTYDSSISPKSQFNPFPVRNSTRKPKELGLKLGLYSPSSPGSGQSKRS